jgi:hypothetical protein
MLEDFMPDIIEQSTLYKIRQIELAEAQYYEQLIKVLDKIEQDITSLVGKTLNTEDGKLLREAKFSLVLQPQIKAILEKEYLPWADKVVREGFNKQAKRVERAFKKIGRIPKQFQELTKGDLALIRNLKQQYFTQFKDVSNTFTRTLQSKVYQNVLLGNEFTVLEQELRQSINGIYASAKDIKIQRLVDKIKKDEVRLKKLKRKSTKAKVLKKTIDTNVQTLQTKFASDRAGENMKKYSGQILNDSLREFDATLSANKAFEAELTHFKYYGNVIPTTRRHCASLVRRDKLFTIDEVKRLGRANWTGKKSGDQLIVRGGYNCRHQWSPVDPEWFSEDGALKY